MGRNHRLGQTGMKEVPDAHSSPTSVCSIAADVVIHPKTITFVEFTFNCEETERWLRLELSGRCPPEGFQEMLPLVSGWWCH